MRILKFVAVAVAAAVLSLVSLSADAQQIRRLDLQGNQPGSRNFQALDNILDELGRHVTTIRMTDLSTAATHFQAAGHTGRIKTIIIAMDATGTDGQSKLLYLVNGQSIMTSPNVT